MQNFYLITPLYLVNKIKKQIFKFAQKAKFITTIQNVGVLIYITN